MQKILLVWLTIILLTVQGLDVAQAQDAVVDASTPTAAPQADQKSSTRQLIIHFKKGAQQSMLVDPDTQTATVSQASGLNLTYVRELADRSVVLKLPQSLTEAELQAVLAKIAQLPEVELAEPDVRVYAQMAPNDPRYNEQWHYFAPTAGNYGANLPGAWDITTGAANIVVAVLDTGQRNHADLAGRFVAGYDFITDATTANDGNGRDADPSDPGDWCNGSNSSWHGTHVAGTIGAKSNNGVGVAGVNWVSKLQHVRVLGTCGGDISDIADAIRWAAGLNVPGIPTNATPAKVINLSLGGAGACGTTLQNAITAAVNAGTVVVVAAGNASQDASNSQPANCNNVITVAATNRSGNMAFYSNYGSKVEIAAPGGETGIFSSQDGVLSTLNAGTTTPGADSYAFYQGTSMATPHVAGIVSLLFSVKPAITPVQVLSILQSTATRFPNGSSCNTTNCGAGIINAAAAVAAAQGGLLPPTDLQATAASATQINLRWSDNSGDETGFKIERCQGANCNTFSQLATVGANSTTYTNSGVAANTSYSYRVRALKNNTESAPSNVATVSTGQTGCSLYTSSDLPKTIEDLSTAVSTVNVTGALTVNDVNLRSLTLDHTYISDLTARLVSPNGTQVELFSGIGGGGDGFSGTSLDDEATTPIANGSAPFSGAYRPSGQLSAFDGQAAAGTWRLEISDNSFFDTGTLTGWALELCGNGGSGGDLIFEDGFESGGFSQWSSTSKLDGGDLSVSAAAALVGSRGMSILMDDTAKLYVTDDTPNAEARYRARFKFDPNGIVLPNKLGHFIFYGYKGNSTVILRIEFRLFNGNYQLRAGIRRDDSSWKSSAWYPISDAPHALEVDWQAASRSGANNGGLTFWIDGVEMGKISGIDNDTQRIDRIRLGAIAGVDNGARGSYYFDAFKSTRTSYIGPNAAAMDEVTAATAFVDEAAPEQGALIVEEDLDLDDVGEVEADGQDGEQAAPRDKAIFLPFVSR